SAAVVRRGALAQAGLDGADAVVLVHPGAATDWRRHRLVPGSGDGRCRCHGIRTTRARLRRACLCGGIFSPPGVALPAVATGRAGGAASALLRRAGALGARRWRSTHAALDLCRGTADRRVVVAGSVGPAAMAAASNAIARRAIAMRRLFAKRDAGPGLVQAPELKDPEREVYFFRRRLTVAGALIIVA